MRRLLAASVILVALTPSLAYGSGPSSVLITDPAHRISAAAHAGDDRYRRLAAAVGLTGTRVPTVGDAPPAVGAVFNADVRLTWLIDEATVWRIDLIFVTPRDGIWVATSADWISEPADAVWHRPSDPDTLRAVLIEAGLAEAAAGAFPPVLAQPPVEPRPGFPIAGYALGGALAGVVIMMAAPLPRTVKRSR